MSSESPTVPDNDALPAWSDFGPLSKQLVMLVLNDAINKRAERLQELSFSMAIGMESGGMEVAAGQALELEMACATATMSALQAAQKVLTDELDAPQSEPDVRGERYFVALQKLKVDLDGGLGLDDVSSRISSILLSVEGLHG
jgi:hypothetical protein